MRFFLNDFWIVATGTVVISVFSTLFYFDINKKVDIGNAQEIGKITFKRRVAQRKYANQVVWEDVQQEFPIYNNDTIRTTDLSEAVVFLNDGTEILINENSMIMLTMEAENVNIDFSHGSLSTKREDSKKKLNIKSGGSEVVAGAGALSLARSKKGTIGLSVQKGSAELAAGGKVAAIGKDQKALVSKDSQIDKFEIKLRQILPENQKYIFSKQNKLVQFTWDTTLKGYKIFLQLSSNINFEKILIQKESKNKILETILKPGIYYWRLKAINDKTKKIFFSDNRRFTILKEQPLQLITPEKNKLISYRNNIPIVFFNWSKSDLPTVYKLVISKDKNFENILKEYNLRNNNIAVDTLADGIHYWKVEATTNLRGEKYSQKSENYMFNVGKLKEIIPPKLINPVNNYKVSKRLLTKKSVLFNWKKNNEIKETEIFIATDKEFENIKFTKKIKNNFIEFKDELPEGKYFWRVLGHLEKEEKTKFSEMRVFNILKNVPITLIMPKNNQKIYSKQDQKDVSLAFAWKKMLDEADFLLQISKQKDFSKIYKELNTKTYYNKISKIQPGNYYWRVKMRENGEDLLVSQVYAFNINEALKAPEISFPVKNGVVNMSDQNKLLLKWKKTKNADYYIINLYYISNRGPIFVFNKKTNNLEYSISDLSKLDTGKFMWTIQAFKDEEDKQEIKSKMNKNYFSITLDSKGKKPKILTPKTIYFE